MRKQNQSNRKTNRGGDTSRTSSQGRKLASGENDKRSDQEMDETTKSPRMSQRKKKFGGQ